MKTTNVTPSAFGSGTWVSGQHDGYTYEAKVFAEPSKYGIPTPRFEEGGNVSMLHLRDENGREVYLYDRRHIYGETVRHYVDAANEIVAALEAKFCEA
jgi:hypothetical protein